MVGTPRCVGTCLASPEGRRRLAGGANHRLGHSMGFEPRQGRPNNNARFPTPFQGLGLTFAINRWFAPPANLPRPSGTLNTYARRPYQLRDIINHLAGGEGGGLPARFRRLNKSLSVDRT